MPSDDPKAIWAGLADTPLPYIQHFYLLEEAADFLRSGDGSIRALGFFAAVDSPEHAVFLTVAKKVAAADAARPWELMMKLGRATIGRGTRGATVYLAPRDAMVAPNGTVLPSPRLKDGFLTHQFRLPASADDAEEVREAWLRDVAHHAPVPRTPTSSPPSPPPPLPPPIKMWEELLEREATALHRFLERGALPPLTEVTAATMEVLAASSRRVGVLLLPPTLDASRRRYHLNRLGRLAARRTPLRCTDAATMFAEDAWKVWAAGTQNCTLATADDEAVVRFAYASPGKPLAALFTSQLGVPAADAVAVAADASPGGGGGGGRRVAAPRFVLLERVWPRARKARAASAAIDAAGGAWRMAEMHPARYGDVSEANIGAFLDARRGGGAAADRIQHGVDGTSTARHGENDGVAAGRAEPMKEEV